MSEYTEQLCRVCLRSNAKCNIVDASQYLNVFTKLFEVESKVTLWLCIWCRAIIKKVKDLLDTAKYVNMLPDGKKVEAVHQVINNLSFHYNPHIDIPPKETCMVKKDIKTEKKDKTDESSLKKEQNIQNMRSNKIKKRKLDEMNFDVFYLNVEEQKKEIDDRKNSEKYIKCGYKCEYCGVSFMFKDDYDEHQKRHDMASGDRTCNICFLKFKSMEVLSQHTLAHRRRFECRSCGTKLKRWSHCVAHRFKCGTNRTPAVCAVCKKIFGDQHSLKIHVKSVHDNNKNYVCNYCDKPFCTKQRLTVHIRSHTGLKPFSCETCLRTFATGSNLRAHSKVHSDKKDHYCVECNKYYKTAKSLKRHFVEASRHAGDGRFSCNECLKKFATEKILQKHVTTAHMTEYRCVHCFKLFSNNANLKKHVRSIHTTTES